jgi:hypothetical protein
LLIVVIKEGNHSCVNSSHGVDYDHMEPLLRYLTSMTRCRSLQSAQVECSFKAANSIFEAIKLSQLHQFRMIVLWAANGLRAPSRRSVDLDTTGFLADHLGSGRMSPSTIRAVDTLKALRGAGIMSPAVLVSADSADCFQVPSLMAAMSLQSDSDEAGTSSEDDSRDSFTSGVTSIHGQLEAISLDDVEPSLCTIIRKIVDARRRMARTSLGAAQGKRFCPCRRHGHQGLDDFTRTCDNDKSDSECCRSGDALGDHARAFWTQGSAAYAPLNDGAMEVPGPLMISIPHPAHMGPSAFMPSDVPSPPARSRDTSIPCTPRSSLFVDVQTYNTEDIFPVGAAANASRDVVSTKLQQQPTEGWAEDSRQEGHHVLRFSPTYDTGEASISSITTPSIIRDMSTRSLSSRFLSSGDSCSPADMRFGSHFHKIDSLIE